MGQERGRDGVLVEGAKYTRSMRRRRWTMFGMHSEAWRSFA